MTSAELAALWARRVNAVNPQVRQTVRSLGNRMLAVSLKHMQTDIYDKPIDVSSSGKPKWKRTDDLKEAENLEFDADGAGCRLINATAYAAPRHEAGKPGRRKTNRPAHWRDEMLAELRQEIPETLHQMNRRILRGR